MLEATGWLYATQRFSAWYPQSFSPHDRCPKDMCGTPQFSFFGHPSFYNKRHTSINFHFVASKTFVTVTPFSFHFVWATRSTQYVWTKALSAACTPTSSELSSFNPGDGRQTPEPALEPQEPPESKLKPKAQAGKHCMIRILIMRTFHNLRTSPEPAPKAALKRTGLRPRTQRCWKKELHLPLDKECPKTWHCAMCSSAFKSGLCDVVQIQWRFLTCVCFSGDMPQKSLYKRC